jgi:hypothetical protein
MTKILINYITIIFYSLSTNTSSLNISLNTTFSFTKDEKFTKRKNKNSYLVKYSGSVSADTVYKLHICRES